MKNTVFNVAGRSWFALVSFFLTPFIIHRIGVDRYGILAIAGVIAGYCGLLDFGIGSSFGRFIAAYHASREPEKIGEVIGIGLVFYTLAGVMLMVPAFFFLNPLIEFFKIPAALHDEAYIVFLAGVIFFLLANTGSVFVSVQAGLQRMDLINKVGIVVSCINIAGTVFVLREGFGLVGLVVNNAVILVVSVLINAVIAGMLVPDAMKRCLVFSTAMFRQLFSFGWRMQIARISGLITAQVDKILLVSFLSIGLVTFYQLGSAIVMYAAALSGLLTSSLMPAFTEITVRKEGSRLVEAYLRSTKYLALIIIPLFTFLILAASRIMVVWMNQPYAQAAFVIRILSIGWMVNTIAQVAASMCVAINKPQFMARGSVIIIVLNLVLSAIFIKLFGFAGAAWGGTIALVAGTTYFIIELHRSLRIPLKSLAAITIPCGMASCGALVVTLLAAAAVRLDALSMGRGWQAAALSFQCVVFALTYLAALRLFRFVGKADILYFKQALMPSLRPGRQGGTA